NINGQFGTGNTTSSPTPTSAAGGTAVWRDVALGSNSTCGVRVDGTLWCWGTNTRGQVGVGDITQRLSPTQVGTAADWQRVSAGTEFACGIRAGGSLWCWGYNHRGQL